MTCEGFAKQLEEGATVPEDPFLSRLGEPHHTAYVVEDIAATVTRLAEGLGAGPFFLVENVPLEDVRSRGEPAEFAHHSAFGASGGWAIELIQPIRLAPARVEAGFALPRPGVHHVAFVVPASEVAGVRGALDARGMPEYLSSRLGEVDATLHDATAVLGHSLEIHVDGEGLRGFFAMVLDAGRGWDGSQPLRPLS